MPKHCARDTYGEVGVNFHSLLTWELNRRNEWLTSGSGSFSPEERASSPHCRGRLHRKLIVIEGLEAEENV
jgi:hypothetical protein